MSENSFSAPHVVVIEGFNHNRLWPNGAVFEYSDTLLGRASQQTDSNHRPGFYNHHLQIASSYINVGSELGSA